MSTVEEIITNIQTAVLAYLERYFQELGDEMHSDLYQLILEQVERPLLTEILRQAGYNQCRATQYLGLARGTVLKKLKQYGLIQPKLRRAPRRIVATPDDVE